MNNIDEKTLLALIEEIKTKENKIPQQVTFGDYIKAVLSFKATQLELLMLQLRMPNYQGIIGTLFIIGLVLSSVALVLGDISLFLLSLICALPGTISIIKAYNKKDNNDS